MSCHRYEAILKELALGVPTTPEVDAHLDECVRCRDWLADERRLLAAVQWTLEGPMDAKPSEDFLGQVRKRLARERMVRSWDWPAWMPAVAASVVIGLGVVAIQRRGEVAKREPPPRAVVTPQSPATTVTPATSSPSRTSVSRHTASAAPARSVALEVLVEPGQSEALAQALRAVSNDRRRPTFVVVSLDAEAPLPSLRSRDLPRFETKRLEVKSVFDGNERGGL